MRSAFTPLEYLRSLRVAVVALGALAAACAAPEKFETATYDYKSANLLFSEALNHLNDNYIDPIDLQRLSIAGLNGLRTYDPTIRALVGPGQGYVVYSGGAEPAKYAAPVDHDASGWASLLAEAVATARERSPSLKAQTPDDVYTAVMDGMTATLDGFSRYESPKRAAESRARRKGYGGIGVTIRDEEGETVIQEVIPDSPAGRANLQAKDIITHADGVPLRSLKKEDRAERLRGPIGKTVDVSVWRQNVTPFTVRLERAEIIPTTVYFINDQNLPRFRISSFSRNTADALSQAIADAERATGGLPGIVLDLRGNPGGYLTQAVDVADLFMEGGVVVSTHGRHPSSSSSYRARTGVVAQGKPLILLIDGGSASASELLAAALVDAGRAVAVGSVTYGKGSIQNLEALANGGELIVTWSRMHAPSGYLLDGLGVRPTVCTKPDDSNAEALILESRRHVQEAASWRAYTAPNQQSMGQLRAICPKVDAGGDIDIAVARQLLTDRKAYEATLTPAADNRNHALLQLRPPKNS